MPANHTDLEKRLWDAADELRANSKLKSSEYSIPVLGLVFLRYADHKFAEAERKMPQKASGRRKIGLRFSEENTHGYRPWQYHFFGQRL
jgi:type I restriction enzyme M protein